MTPSPRTGTRMMNATAHVPNPTSSLCSANNIVSDDLQLANVIVSSLFAFLTVFLNGLIILSVIIDPMKRLKTPFIYFLVNLAVSDFLCGCVAMTLSAYLAYIKIDGGVGSTIHTIVHIATFISALASLLSLAVLCLDRYFAIRYPLQYRLLLSLRRCVLISAGIWVVSTALPFLYLESRLSLFMLIYINIALAIILPILLITFYNVRSLLTTKARAISDARGSTNKANKLQEDKNREVERRVTRVFLAIVLLFIATYLPAAGIAYGREFGSMSNCLSLQWMRIILLLLIFTNSFMNAIICIAMMRPFRDSVVYILGRCFRCLLDPTAVSETSTLTTSRS